MILADKIINLRKKNGMSQEELAEKLNVSRQSVSKWEGAQSIPDLDKIIQMSEFFGVTTDYLLKDNMEEEEFLQEDKPIVKKVSLEQANSYINHKSRMAKIIAISVLLCIISPITLIVLSGIAEAGAVTDTFATVTGIVVIFACIATAVAGFIYSYYKEEPYAYLSEPFDREYGVEGAVREKKKAFAPTVTRLNVIATLLCIISALPIIIFAILEKELMTVIMIGVALLIIGCAVAMYVIAGVRYSAYAKILMEGEFKKNANEKSSIRDYIDSAYWTLTVAVYLCWSFISGNWGSTWIIWPIAAVCYSVFCAVMSIFNKNYRDSDN